MPEIKERPILFSAPMVRAILEGRKTVTRRIVKPVRGYEDCSIRRPDKAAASHSVWWHGRFESVGVMQDCPYGKPGDRLWVREAWARIGIAQAPDQEWVVYRESDNRTDYGGPWKPGIHMLRRDSRILLEITDVRVERLQDISPDQAFAEGVNGSMCQQFLESSPTRFTCREAEIHGFSGLWESINGADSWDANPWVWVVEFKQVTP